MVVGGGRIAAVDHPDGVVVVIRTGHASQAAEVVIGVLYRIVVNVGGLGLRPEAVVVFGSGLVAVGVADLGHQAVRHAVVHELVPQTLPLFVLRTGHLCDVAVGVVLEVVDRRVVTVGHSYLRNVALVVHGAGALAGGASAHIYFNRYAAQVALVVIYHFHVYHVAGGRGVGSWCCRDGRYGN